jgi:hypothetical protein
MMLRDSPATVAPDEDPGHAIWNEILTVGEIDVAGGDHYVFGNLTNNRHRVGFHTDARWAPAEIVTDGLAVTLQFIDRTEQGSVLVIEFHVSVEVVAVERFNPLSEQAFDGSRCGHATPFDVRRTI